MQELTSGTLQKLSTPHASVVAPTHIVYTVCKCGCTRTYCLHYMQVWLHPHILSTQYASVVAPTHIVYTVCKCGCTHTYFVVKCLIECLVPSLQSVAHLASSPGHSQIFSCSHGKKSVEGLVPLLHHEHHNDGNTSTQYVASTVSDQTVKFA